MPCGVGVIGVEYLMNYLRPWVSNWTHSLMGKNYPRRVTAPNGSPRWQARSGRTFESIEEAARG